MAKTPTAYELDAAIVASRLIDGAGSTLAALKASYASAATGGLYRADDLSRGQELLLRAGLLEATDNWFTPSRECVLLRDLPADVAVEILLQLVLTSDPPLWLFAAIHEEQIRWENVPDRDEVALRQSIADADRREALLLNLGRTIDERARTELGAAGEEHVVAECRNHLAQRGREDLAREVRQVSQLSDQLGYDVTSPDTAGRRHRLEVKTTTGVAGTDSVVSVYISRNEAMVGQSDGSWALVAVRKDIMTGEFEIVGWCHADAFAPALPSDPSPWGHWASTRIFLEECLLSAGLPLDVSGCDGGISRRGAMFVDIVREPVRTDFDETTA